MRSVVLGASGFLGSAIVDDLLERGEHYSKDAARLTVDYLRAGVVNRTPDCGTGVAMTVNAVAEAVSAYYGNRAGIQQVPTRKVETPNTHLVADTRELEEVLGELSFTDWETALAETLDWYAQLDPH